MKQQNLVLQSLKYIIIDLLGDFVKFPIWWYGKGTYRALMFCVNGFLNAEKSLGLKVWVKNIFKPMFGQTDWQGKIISFFMRVFQIIGRTIALVIYFVLLVIVFIIWLLLPVFIVFQLLSLLAS